MFIPPHCPNPECIHYFIPADNHWYRKISPYSTITFGSVWRFLCKACRKTFSTQTFSIDYFAKKKLNHRYIFNQINAGAGLRNIARDLKVSPKAITNRISRLTRNAIFLHQAILDELPYSEHFAADGFESFCVSQYFPDNYNILVGEDSQFVYHWDYVSLCRKGRRTEKQKEKRIELEKRYQAPKKGIEDSFRELSEFLEKKTHTRNTYVIFSTDEKKDYERALYKSLIYRNPNAEERGGTSNFFFQLRKEEQHKTF